MYRSNRSSSLGKVLSEGYYRPDTELVRKSLSPWDPNYTFAALQDIVDSYNAAPADIARPQTVGFPWAIVTKSTNPDLAYAANIAAPKILGMPAKLAIDDPLLTGAGGQFMPLFHVGGNPLPADYNQYGVIGTPDDFGEQTGGDATKPAPVVTGTTSRTTRTGSTSPAPTTGENGDRDPAPTSQPPVVPPVDGTVGGNEMPIMLMPILGAVAGYMLGGKSVFMGAAGFVLAGYLQFKGGSGFNI